MGIAGESCTKISRVALAAVLLFVIGTVTPAAPIANPVVAAASCRASSGSWVNSALPQPQTGAFRVEFDATPSSTGVDGVIGLSSGPAGDYPNLAAIVRFNATGTIDARNGAAYTAANAIAYSAGTAYHFILDINATTHTYNASVVVNGVAVVIGTKLTFRSEQAGVSSLNNIASMASSGSQTICNVVVTPTSGTCLSSSGSWINSTLPQPQTGAFRVEFDATPSSTGVDGVIGLSSGPAGDYPNLAAIVRFNATGTIDARNGAAYTAANAIAYSAGTTYHFILDINVTTHTYNASVVVNGVAVAIGTKLTFRSEQAGVSSLNNIASMASSGSQTICSVAVSAVPVAPSITTQPISQTVTAGQAATFSVATTGTSVSYQWQKSGAPISGATSSTYQTPVTAVSDSGSQFTVVVSNTAGSLNSSGATLTVKPPVVAPSITMQPLSQTVTAGQTAVFSVATTGTSLSYQWLKNGAAIGGASSSTYQTPVTAVFDSGFQFSVVVSNTAGSVNSSGATLTVKSPAVAPSITTQPLSQTVTAGQTATFLVAGTGTAPVSYQWQKNGAAIGGATSSTYETAVTAVADDASQFTVVMSNSAGSVTSNPATLTVVSANCLSSSAAWVNSTLPQAETGTFRLEFDATPSSTGIDGVVGLSSGPASDYSNLAAIVRFNATGTIDARNGAAYTAAAAISYSAGTTYHFVLDVNVTAHTYNASVVVNGTPVVIGTQLAFRTEQAGASSLSNIGAMAAAGSQTICNVVVTPTSNPCLSSSGSWVNSPLSQTETGAFQLAFDATPSSTGIDGVVGLSSGPASAYTSLAAIVRFNLTGTIDAVNGSGYTAATAIPYSAGTAYHFILNVNVTAHTYDASVVVNGAPVVIGTKLAFRTEQAGASSLNSIGAMAGAGSQTICNVAVSAMPPSITTQPVSQTVTPGQAAMFSVEGTGTAPMSYQWQKNGTAISGATSSTYQTPATALSDNGSQFSVVVTDPAGSVTSGSTTLTVSTGSLLLGASSTQMSFGSVNVSSNDVQNVTIANNGNSNVTISNVAVSGAGFNAGGGASGLILSPGQTVPLSITFAPAASGSASGSITVTSNATNSPIRIALTGTGLAQAHSVSLNWTASTSSVAGYNVYSSRASGGPYVRLNPAPMGATSYTDTTVQPGQTYYYVTTAVRSSSGTAESGFSAEVSAIIP